MEAGILSNDLPWSWINIPKCPRCNNSFLKKNEKSRFVLLPCSHSVCVGCISSLSMEPDPKCDQCLSKIRFNRSMYPDSQFESDFYAYGLALYKTSTLPNMVKNNKIGDFLPEDRTLTVMSALPESKCNECSMCTQHECVQCKVPYCNKCFDEVHAGGKVLRRHQIVPINAILLGRVRNPCKHHNNEMDHYCQTCKVPICRLCSYEAHRKHETTKLISNKKLDLDETMNILKSAQEKIDETTRIAEAFINKISNNAKSTAENISKKFHHYHGILQNIEKDTLIELQKRTLDYMQKMHQVENCLRLSSEKIDMTKSQVIKFSKNIPADINLATVHGEVMSLLEDMPIDLKIEHFDENPFSFDVPDFDQSAVTSTFQVMFEENRFLPKLNTLQYIVEPYSEDHTDDTLLCNKGLANIKPKSKEEWSKSAIDEFESLTTSDGGYDALAVSVCGNMANDSLPLHLWGQKKLYNCPLSASSNTDEKFASNESQDCIEKFKTIVDCDSVDDQMQLNETVDIITSSAELIDRYVDVNTDEVKKETSFDEDFPLESASDPQTDDYCKIKVNAWLPANPIGKYQFTAIPTYVGNNAVIYLHATSQMEYLQQMKSTINNQLQNMPCDMSYEWKVGDTCMVRYHLDECFYRGLIKDVMQEKQFKIEFVDYGNIEECNQCDILEANILGDVPIQATKYYLPFLKPKNENGFWDRSVLEFIHGNIVNKMVSVRVGGEDNINEEFIPCSITIGGINMHKVMIAENLADHTYDANIKLQHSHIDYSEDSHETADRNQNQQSISSDKFEEKMTEKSEAEKQKEYNENDDLSADDIVVDDSDELFEENTLLPNDESVEFDFVPMDNSTEISNTSPKTLNLYPFMEFKPSKDIKKMSAKIIDIIDPVHIILEPIIEEFIDNWEKMEEKIKQTPHKSTEKFNFKQNRACLARYVGDNCYYRAIIKDPHYSNDSVRVVFVDYLETKIVERKFIRQCPVEVLEQPLRYFIVKLHGLTPYPRIPDPNITNRLKEFKDKKTILKPVKYHTSPKSVHLYDSENENMLIYQSLIDQKFYKQC